MIEWWWLIPAFFVGLVVGMAMCAIMGANQLNGKQDENPPSPKR